MVDAEVDVTPGSTGTLVATAAPGLFAHNRADRPRQVGLRAAGAEADHLGRCTIELAPGAVGALRSLDPWRPSRRRVSALAGAAVHCPVGCAARAPALPKEFVP
jgi:hypothetical protein